MIPAPIGVTAEVPPNDSEHVSFSAIIRVKKMEKFKKIENLNSGKMVWKKWHQKIQEYVKKAMSLQ